MLLVLLAGLVSVIRVYTVVDNRRMGAIEGRPRSIFRSFQTVDSE